MPGAAYLGSIAGTGISRTDNDVTATFVIPADQPAGLLDATVEIDNPSETMFLTKSSAFEVLAASGVPVADAGGPYSGDVDAAITLDGSASNDSDGTITLYEWDLDNDGSFDDATGVTTDFSSATVGTFTVGLRVTDNDSNTDTGSATITVRDPAATVDVT